jgi:hypothetical protein
LPTSKKEKILLKMQINKETSSESMSIKMVKANKKELLIYYHLNARSLFILLYQHLTGQ